MSAAQLRIRAHADPQTLSRLINYVAQLGAVPRRVSADTANGMMDVMIEPQDLADAQIDSIAEKMRVSVLVESVRIARGEPQPCESGERP